MSFFKTLLGNQSEPKKYDGPFTKYFDTSSVGIQGTTSLKDVCLNTNTIPYASAIKSLVNFVSKLSYNTSPLLTSQDPSLEIQQFKFLINKSPQSVTPNVNAQMRLVQELISIIKSEQKKTPNITIFCLLNMQFDYPRNRLLSQLGMTSSKLKSTNKNNIITLTLLDLVAVLGYEGVCVFLIYNGAIPGLTNLMDKDSLYLLIESQIRLYKNNSNNTLSQTQIQFMILLFCSCPSGNSDASRLVITDMFVDKNILFHGKHLQQPTSQRSVRIQDNLLHLLIRTMQNNTNNTSLLQFCLNTLRFLLVNNNLTLPNKNIIKTISNINTQNTPWYQTPLFTLIYYPPQLPSNILTPQLPSNTVTPQSKSSSPLSILIKLFLINKADIFILPNPALPVNLNLCDYLLISGNQLDQDSMDVLKSNQKFSQECQIQLGSPQSKIELRQKEDTIRKLTLAVQQETGLPPNEITKLADSGELLYVLSHLQQGMKTGPQFGKQQTPFGQQSQQYGSTYPRGQTPFGQPQPQPQPSQSSFKQSSFGQQQQPQPQPQSSFGQPRFGLPQPSQSSFGQPPASQPFGQPQQQSTTYPPKSAYPGYPSAYPPRSASASPYSGYHPPGVAPAAGGSKNKIHLRTFHFANYKKFSHIVFRADKPINAAGLAFEFLRDHYKIKNKEIEFVIVDKKNKRHYKYVAKNDKQRGFIIHVAK